MASVRFSRRPNLGAQIRFEASFDRLGVDLGQRTPLSADEILAPKPGIPGFVPTGSDRGPLLPKMQTGRQRPRKNNKGRISSR